MFLLRKQRRMMLSCSTGSISDIQNGGQMSEHIQRLEAQLRQTKEQLNDAYEIIDELDFEVDQIDFLESENEQLQEEINRLKVAAVQRDEFPVQVSSDRVFREKPYNRLTSSRHWHVVD